jgi:hypothetical protein
MQAERRPGKVLSLIAVFVLDGRRDKYHRFYPQPYVGFFADSGTSYHQVLCDMFVIIRSF